MFFATGGSRLLMFALVLGLGCASTHAQAQTRTVHVFVALCDNQHQRIVPVPAGLGDGDDPAGNLYWGAQYGVKTFLAKHEDWDLLTTLKEPEKEILQRCIFRHRTQTMLLVADAYRGKAIKSAIQDFLGAAAGNRRQVRALTLDGKTQRLELGGLADLVVYVGHNGLMDFRAAAPAPAHERNVNRQAMVFCCRSDAFFKPLFKITRTDGLVTTFGLMAPEGYVVEAAVASWARGETEAGMRRAAADAYRRYQKCSATAANRLFGRGMSPAM